MMPLLAWDCLRPWALALLVPLAALAFGLARGARARRGSGRVAVSLRVLVLALMIVAVARPRTWDEVETVGVVFALDVSRSVPAATRDAAIKRIEGWFDRMPTHGQASLILFARRPALEIPFRSHRMREDDAGFGQRLNHLESRFSLTETDVGAALEFAAGIFPDGMARRVVLLCDGNQTTGDLMSSAEALAVAGITLDVVPLTFRHGSEVMVEGVFGPPEGRLQEPVQLRTVITAQTATEATLQLLADGVAAGPPTPVSLQAGTNVFRFAPELTHSGLNSFELVVDAVGDGNPTNNVGRMGVLVAGHPEVLVVSRDDHDERLTRVLSDAGLSARRVDPRGLPDHPAGYLSVDTVVLNDVPADGCSPAQIEALRDAVKELGRGLVTIGGPHSFAPGGWAGTALEDVFPVDLSTRNRRVLPKGALVIILHSVEFDSGNVWAVRLSKSALQGLSATDEAGVIVYDQQHGEQWLFPLALLGDKSGQLAALDRVFPGDMVSFHQCFQLAQGPLIASDAALKHVIVVSDGDPTPPDPLLLTQLANARVTVSTVCIAPHHPSATGTMKDLATIGGGRYYELVGGNDLELLPRIMLKESATLRRAAIKEEPFVPVTVLAQSALLRGIEAWPELRGYAITGARPGAETILLADAENEDPLLAAWYVGLGRSIAFTSDATSRWAAEWLSWERFAPFWTQVVRSAARTSDPSPFPMTVTARGLTLQIRMGARDERGVPLTDLLPAGSVLGDAGGPIPFRMVQQEAGEYVAEVRVTEPGQFLASVAFTKEGTSFAAQAATSIDYSPEHRFLTSDDAILRRAAAVAGGRELSAADDPFRRDISGARGRRELWPTLLVGALVALVAEIVIRRLDVSWSTLVPAAWRGRWTGWRQGRQRAPGPQGKHVPAGGPSVSGEAPPRDRSASLPQAPSRDAGDRPVAGPSAAGRSAADSSGDPTLEQLKKARDKAQRKRKWQGPEDHT